MNRDFKVGDWVIYYKKNNKLANKIGKIIEIDTRFPQTPYYVKFKNDFAWLCAKGSIKLYLEHLKLKKLIEHGV